MSARTKKQHFVPQFYLSAFSNDGGVWCYDKVLDRCWGAKVKDVAQERDFNEYSGTSDASNPDSYQMVERGLATVEGLAAKKLPKVISKVVWSDSRSSPIISKGWKRDIACYVALQLLRTKESRELTREVMTKIRGAVRKAVSASLPDVEFANEDIRPTEDYVNWHHLSTMFTDAIELTPVLMNKVWAFYYAFGGSLWTSDHPVVLDSDGPTSESVTGLDVSGVRILFPLSPHVLLRMYDIETCPANIEDCKVFEIQEAGVSRANERQLGQCYRQVYSKQNDVIKAQVLCQEEPTFRNTERERIDVAGLGGDDLSMLEDETDSNHE